MEAVVACAREFTDVSDWTDKFADVRGWSDKRNWSVDGRRIHRRVIETVTDSFRQAWDVSSHCAGKTYMIIIIIVNSSEQYNTNNAESKPESQG